MATTVSNNTSPATNPTTTSPPLNGKMWSEMLEDDSDDDYFFEALPPTTSTPRKQVVGCGNLAEDEEPSTLGKPAKLSAVNQSVDSHGEEPGISPIKSEGGDFAASEILVQCSIPYKMKSLCSTPATVVGAGTTPDLNKLARRPSLNITNSPAPQQPDLHNTSIASSSANTSMTAANRHQRAVEALEKVLHDRASTAPAGEEDPGVHYSDLMKASNWRVRFQPSLGSLFTFLKKHRDLFSYKHAVVRLLPREALVQDLMNMNWKQQ